MKYKQRISATSSNKEGWKVSAVEASRFQGSTISQDLKWASHINSIIKKTPQRMWFLHQVRKFNLPQELLIQFYTAITQSALCTSITFWFGSATRQDRNRLQCTVRTADKTVSANLPSIQDIHFQSPEMSRKHHYKSITPWTQPVPTSPLW